MSLRGRLARLERLLARPTPGATPPDLHASELFAAGCIARAQGEPEPAGMTAEVRAEVEMYWEPVADLLAGRLGLPEGIQGTGADGRR